MTGRTLAALLAAALAGPAAAWAAPHEAHGDEEPPPAGAGHGGHGAVEGRTATVTMGASAFLPPRLDVLAGDTVRWRNDSVRRHTVTAVDGGWDAGVLLPGDRHERALHTTGAVAYLCRLHAGMRGEVGVHRVLLDRGRQPAAPGRPFPLTGRAALPAGATVALEADAGHGFQPAGHASVGTDGRFAATIRPQGPATYRAVAGAEVSPAVPVLVANRTVRTSLRRDGGRATITATVAPVSAGATVVLQLRMPERFGWWPVARARLDARSRARFVLRPRRTLPARVVLTLPDGATRLAESRTFRLRGSARR